MENCAFRIPNGLVANKARLLDDKVLINTASAEVVAANSGLTLVNEIQTQRANKRLVIITRLDLLILAILRSGFSGLLVINEPLDVLDIDVGGHKLLLLDDSMDLPQLFFAVDHSL